MDRIRIGAGYLCCRRVWGTEAGGERTVILKSVVITEFRRRGPPGFRGVSGLSSFPSRRPLDDEVGAAGPGPRKEPRKWRPSAVESLRPQHVGRRARSWALGGIPPKRLGFGGVDGRVGVGVGAPCEVNAGMSGSKRRVIRFPRRRVRRLESTAARTRAHASAGVRRRRPGSGRSTGRRGPRVRSLDPLPLPVSCPSSNQ